MNEDKVVVKVKTCQEIIGESIEVIEETYYGYLTEKRECIYIKSSKTKDESEKKDVIKISKNDVLIMRRGTTVSNMKFSEGKLYRTKYYTPYNVLDLVIDTNSIVKNIHDEGMEIVIDYNLIVEGFFECKSVVNVDIKKQDW